MKTKINPEDAICEDCKGEIDTSAELYCTLFVHERCFKHFVEKIDKEAM